MPGRTRPRNHHGGRILIGCMMFLCLFFVLPAYALPGWIQESGNETRFTTACGNVLVYNDSEDNAHMTDFFHDGMDYGGLPDMNHRDRGYTLYEAYYSYPDGSTGDCHQGSANFKGLAYADDNVAVVVSGCSAATHQEMWRYVIPRAQCGFYETERKNVTTNLEATNDQLVQFLNLSALNLAVSDRDGNVAPYSGYAPLFTQFSKPGSPLPGSGGSIRSTMSRLHGL